jgi:hypothetical protein
MTFKDTFSEDERITFYIGIIAIIIVVSISLYIILIR